MTDLDYILDKFHKSKPADTPTYNVFHEQAKAELKALMLELMQNVSSYQSPNDNSIWLSEAELRQKVEEL